MKRIFGFTLIELMIVVAVIATLAIIALPMFTEQLRKGKRSEAIQAISDIQLRQERYRADNPTYGNTTAATSALGNLFGGVAAVASYNSLLNNYSVSVANTNTDTFYVITATRKGSMAADPKCGNFTMTYLNGTSTKGVSSGDADYCWRKK
jgi:type IV pilus assembly protein PilE